MRGLMHPRKRWICGSPLRSSPGLIPVAPPAKQQPELSLQGSLFGEDPLATASLDLGSHVASASADAPQADSLNSNANSNNNDAVWNQPRRRKDSSNSKRIGAIPSIEELLADADANGAAAEAAATQSIGTEPGDATPLPSGPDSTDPEAGSHPDNDLPAWHHHSLVDPLQLTPMLRHYVELKAASRRSAR